MIGNDLPSCPHLSKTKAPFQNPCPVVLQQTSEVFGLANKQSINRQGPETCKRSQQGVGIEFRGSLEIYEFCG